MLLGNERNCKTEDRFKNIYIYTVICHKHVILQAKIPYLTKLLCICENSAQKLNNFSIHTYYHKEKKMKN